MTCPYCGHKAQPHQFLTQAQLDYVKAYSSRFFEIISTSEVGDAVFEVDEVADEVKGKSPTNPFYYSETSQQNKFRCEACGAINDILGTYGFCSCCGTHNGYQEFKSEMDEIRRQIETSNQLKQAVSAFDSLTAKMVKQLTSRAPMTPQLKQSWKRMSFHQLKEVETRLKETFGIRLFSEIQQKEQNLVALCFSRRHVYEHSGGEVDQKYIDDTNDLSVKLGQTLRESKETILPLTNLLEKWRKTFIAIFILFSRPNPSQSR